MAGRHAVLLAAIIPCVVGGPASAEFLDLWGPDSVHGNPAILDVNNSLSLSYLLSRLDYIEPNDAYASTPSGYLDKETGNLKGGRVAVTCMFPLNTYFHVEWSGAESLVDYSGYLQGGPPYIPVNGKSRATTQEFSVKLGKGFTPGQQWMLTPYLSLGRRYWMRELGVGTPGDYVESYNLLYYTAGGLIQYSPLDRLVLSGDVAIGRTSDPSINASLRGVPILNQAALGEALIKKIGTDIDYRLTEALHIFAGFDYTYFTFGQSVIQSSGFLEPYSRTELYNYTFGLRLAFKHFHWLSSGSFIDF
jgi:hypothetical protein